VIPDERADIGIGMLGYAFMGKAHANAFRKLAYIAWPPPLEPHLVAVAGRDERRVTEAAERYGFERAFTRWEELVDSSEIELFDNVGPNNLHAAPTIAAAEAGKHVICEKPLGRDADESFEIWQRVAAAGVTHMCAFNYRFVPAIALTRQMIAGGEIGAVRHFRAVYLQDWGADPNLDTWRFRADEAGSGALGDLGSHVIDLAHALVGEIGAVSAAVRAFMPGRSVDDAVSATLEFTNGAIGTVEASRLAVGHRNALRFEINGADGSVAFDLERLNELTVSRGDGRTTTILVTEPGHPYVDLWWPPGHVIGWEHTFVHELDHLLRSIASSTSVGPIGATLEDGYRAAEVCEALAKSSKRGRREAVVYRTDAALTHAR